MPETLAGARFVFKDGCPGTRISDHEGCPGVRGVALRHSLSLAHISPEAGDEEFFCVLRADARGLLVLANNGQDGDEVAGVFCIGAPTDKDL